VFRLIGKPRRLPVIKADGSEIMAILSLGEVIVDGQRRFVGKFTMLAGCLVVSYHEKG
jgi:hypothetical protein